MRDEIRGLPLLHRNFICLFLRHLFRRSRGGSIILLLNLCLLVGISGVTRSRTDYPSTSARPTRVGIQGSCVDFGIRLGTLQSSGKNERM